MDEKRPNPIEAERGILEIDVTQRRQLRSILEFVRDIHAHIDPDMFRIDADRVAAMLRSLEGDGPEATRLGVTYDDVFFLEIATDAAEAYSQRRRFATVEGVEDEDFAELRRWLTRETNALFRRPPTIH
jgi:hypothetical protein